MCGFLDDEEKGKSSDVIDKQATKLNKNPGKVHVLMQRKPFRNNQSIPERNPPVNSISLFFSKEKTEG